MNQATEGNGEPESTTDAVMALRAEMMAEGWSSEDRLTKMGWGATPGYSIWFERWDWHGQKTLILVGSKACYHAHTPSLDHILDTVREAAERARRAWRDFPDCPPDQDAYHRLVARAPNPLSDKHTS